jgi:hypothetical protein
VDKGNIHIVEVVDTEIVVLVFHTPELWSSRLLMIFVGARSSEHNGIMVQIFTLTSYPFRMYSSPAHTKEKESGGSAGLAGSSVQMTVQVSRRSDRYAGKWYPSGSRDSRRSNLNARNLPCRPLQDGGPGVLYVNM